MTSITDLEQRERDIAARHGIDYDRADRVWLRREALKELRGETAEPMWSPAQGGGAC